MYDLSIILFYDLQVILTSMSIQIIRVTCQRNGMRHNLASLQMHKSCLFELFPHPFIKLEPV
jgi:hypothetical protein